MRYTHSLVFVLVFFIVHWPTCGQAQKRPPSFAEFRVVERYSGRHVAPQLRPNTAAWKYRTRIREAAQGRANFAGHYVVATWGCGIECLVFGIIDLETGKVWCEDQSICCWGMQPADDFEPLRFRVNSRLLVLSGLLDNKGHNGPHYFKFEGNRLVALR